MAAVALLLFLGVALYYAAIAGTCTAFSLSYRSCFIIFSQRRTKLDVRTHARQFTNGETTKRAMAEQNKESDTSPFKLSKSLKSAQLKLRDVIMEGFGTKARNVASTMTVGDVVVPLCANLDQRQCLANRGIYPGVDYKICELSLENDGTSSSSTLLFSSMVDVPYSSRSNVVAKIRPNYPLRKNLERDDWPVSVRPIVDVPLWLSQTTYQAGTALSTLALAVTYLTIASFLAFFIRITYVPSESMMPALQVGDVVLVTRPIFGQHPRVNDVVLFNPPKELDKAIENVVSSMKQKENEPQPVVVVPTKGKQLLKRVVAAPGEKVGVQHFKPFVLTPDNEQRLLRVFDVSSYAHPEIFPEECWDRAALSTLQKNEYFVAGDNGKRSVDSRVWGALKEEYLVGTAKLILFPPERFGMIPSGPFETNLNNP